MYVCHVKWERSDSGSGVDQDSGVQGHCTVPVLGLHDPEHKGTVPLQNVRALYCLILA